MLKLIVILYIDRKLMRVHIIKQVFALVIFSCLIGGELQAQDPYFSQFYANPTYLNPAMAGTSWCPRFVSNYRNQFPSFPGSFVTYAMSYDQHVESIAGGVGLNVMHDRAGDGILTKNNINLMYSYHYAINRRFSVRFGLQAGYFQNRLDGTRLTFGDMIDPRYGFIYETQEQNIITNPDLNKSGLDFGAGILAYSKKFYGGFAMHHLIEPEEGFISPKSSLPRKFTAHVGALIPLERDFKDASISPNFIFQQQLNATTSNIGMYFTKEPFVGGIWYRNSGQYPDAFIMLIGLEQVNKNGPNFKVGYTFDVTLGGVGIGPTSGGHELSLTYIFPCRKKPKRWRTISCPSF